MQSIPATVEVDNGNISIASGSTEIGSWALADVHLEQIPTGYRMAAEGDQILLEMNNVDAFAEAIQTKKSRFKLSRPSKSESKQEPRSSVDVIERPEERKAEPKKKATRRVRREPKPAEEPKKLKTPYKDGFLGKVDAFLVKVSKRFGAYLPSWVFTRAILGLAILTFILMLVFPDAMSLILVAGSVLVILYGAVCYSDPMLASRWLPGRTQPPHVLLAGLCVLFLGILVGLLPY